MTIKRHSTRTRMMSVFTVIMFMIFMACPDLYAQINGTPDTTAAAASPPSAGQGALKQPLPETGNVTVNFKEVDIQTVLMYLSEISGVDIIPSPGVDASVTMRLRNKPWEVALDIVTRNYGYVYSRDDEQGIIRVMPKSRLQAEEPITEVIPLNHIIREIELLKEQDEGDTVAVQERLESIQQLMIAVNSILDTGRGERATYVTSANAIVVTAIPARIQEVKDMIAKIDKKTPQIVLDARVVEIRLDQDERFGVDWNAIITAAGAARPVTFPFNATGVMPWLPGGAQRQFFPFNTAPDGRTDFPSLLDSGNINPITINPSDNALFTYGTLDFSQFTATLSLLQQRGDTEILSSPRITTLNNQKATIKVVDKIMLQKTQETTQTAGIVTVEFEDEDEAREVGVKLTVIPHVNEEGDISVNLLPEVSTNRGFDLLTVGANQTTTVSLTFSSREANTIVRVRDGETIFLGGLIRKNIVKTDNKFPILGDLFGGIPVLGNAFRYEAEDVERTEIVFFITVHMVPDGIQSIRDTQSVAAYNTYVVQENLDRSGVEIKRAEPPKIGQGVMTGKEETVEVKVPIDKDARKKEYKPFLDFRKKPKEKE